jgi:hypothetical protein
MRIEAAERYEFRIDDLDRDSEPGSGTGGLVGKIDSEWNPSHHAVSI